MRASYWFPSLLQLTALALLSAQTPAHAASASATDNTVVRQQFMDAMARVRTNAPELPDSAELSAYVLHDYLLAARLQRDLIFHPGTDTDRTIDAFLSAHVGATVARALAHDWLLSLADRQRWDLFLARVGDTGDPQLACDRLAGRLAVGDTQGLAADAVARWNIPAKAPRECDGVFAWLRAQGQLSAALAETRTRAALTAGNAALARGFALDVPSPRQAALLQWAGLLDSYRASLNVLLAHPDQAVEDDALLAGFSRLANSDSAAAVRMLPLLQQRTGVSSALQLRLQRAAALGAAYDHDPQALRLFQGLPADPTDDDLLQWRVRAALWNADYARALNWIEQMPARLAEQPRWRYWHARALAATAGDAAASDSFIALSDLRDYYGYMAADRAGRGYVLNARLAVSDPAQQAALAAEPGLMRAHELFACARIDDAAIEWAVALSDTTPDIKLQAAQLAARWGWYAQSIATLAQSGEWDDVRLRYPRPFPEAIERASALTQLSPDWILAVMRQESLFRTDAVSYADARGLMQLLPATAASVARRWRLPPPGADALFDPAASVPLGAAYLRELLDRNGGQLELSLAAYNAGSAAVSRWLPPAPMDADIWIENIPYGETRGYIQHILEHIVAFAWVRNAELPRLATLLMPVQPPVPGATAPTGSPAVDTVAPIEAPLAAR